MKLHELTQEQRLQVKQYMLCQRDEQPSYEELAQADTLVSDEELEDEFDGVEFHEDDFVE